MISIIVAMDKRGGIGKNNDLLCRLSDDLKNFKRLTTGNIIVMGRKTFESLPKGALPNRENIVLSRNDVTFEGATVYKKVDEVLEYLKKSDKELFVIGGGEIYKLMLPYTKRLIISHIHHEFEADTFFPAINYSEWNMTTSQLCPANEKNEYAFTVSEYLRVN